MPITEKKKDRTHTSCVTVSVLFAKDLEKKTIFDNLSEKDLKIEWFSGTGAGGQHRNKHQNSCRLTHLPTGITVSAQTRSQSTSKASALSTLQEILLQKKREFLLQSVTAQRGLQAGSGDRGGLKIRTYRFQDGIIIDHVSGKKLQAQDVMNGRINSLWPTDTA